MAYVNLDKIGANAHIESIVSATDLVNGQFVALGELQADGEARLVEASGDQAERLVLHVSNGLVYGDFETEIDFVLKAGKVGRGYVLVEGDVISISEDGVVGTVAKGSFVNPSEDGFEVVDVGGIGNLHGEIIAVEQNAIAGKMAVIRISKK